MQHTIIVENSDSKIWYVENFLIDLCNAMHKNLDIVVDLNSEGPCAESLGLYNLLDQCTRKLNFPKHRITVKTCNQLEQHDEYSVIIDAPLKGISQWQAKLSKQSYFTKNIHNKIKHFGSFVGRGNRLRLGLSNYLYRNYQNKTLQSYHTDVTNDYFRKHLAIDEMLNHGYSWDEVKQSIEFLKKCPLKLDNIVEYPILHETKVYDLIDYYQDIFVDIVNQTYFSGNTFYIDDHLWRSIITKTPFIVQGPQNFLENLKKLGFLTFDQWWDEGYSEDPPDHQVKLIKENVDYLAQKPTSELDSIYKEMIPVLDHNFEVFCRLSEDSFNRFATRKVNE